MKNSLNTKAQHGVTLIEVLIAILIFSVGVLGLVGLQARAVQQSSQAKYRADASLLVNELIGQMWTTARTPAALQTQFSSAPGGPGFMAWQTRVQAALPGSTDFPPTVTLTAVPPLPSPTAPVLLPSTQVTVVVRWRPPSAPAAEPANNLTVTTEIK